MMTLKEQEHSISFCVTRNFHVLAASKCVFFSRADEVANRTCVSNWAGGGH